MTLAVSCLAGCTHKPETWEAKVSRIVWVAYSPPSADPGRGIQPTPEAIRDDLATLRSAGFTGLVTYSSIGVLGRQLPGIAASQGFEGLIVGVWDPMNKEETEAAKAAGQLPIVLGFCVGNEGYKKRYTPAALASTMEEIRKATGKPVTTAEPIDYYSDPGMLKLGDLVFPNAHPYFHNRFDPAAAVRWTKGAYDELKQRSNRFVLFKEVGLPTGGNAAVKLSEENQEQYYLELAKTGVRFVYFEGFDQPWKQELPIEPHWGIFNADRSPKRLAMRMMGTQQDPSPVEEDVFYVYLDAGSPKNHFAPSGYMGDIRNIHIDEACEMNPHSGKTCIRVQCDPFVGGHNGWAGVYWQEPPNNWGKEEFRKNMGFDLSRYRRLVFWARADHPCRIEFKVGGIDEPYGDSQPYPVSTIADIGTTWKQFVIDLRKANLKHTIGGFCWVTNDRENPTGAVFYLDDIRYER